MYLITGVMGKNNYLNVNFFSFDILSNISFFIYSNRLYEC